MTLTGNVYGAQSVAKAWVSFNGTGTVAIRDSFNVTSITDNGTGDYTVNFTNAMASADYALAGAAGNTSYVSFCLYQGVTPTTSAARFTLRNHSSGVAFDQEYTSAVIFGDQ